MAMTAQMGAPGAPPFTFAAKNSPVAWDAVLSFDIDHLINGQEPTPQDLNALDDMARRLEEARIVPEEGFAPEENAARLAKLAKILQLSSEYQAMRAEVGNTCPPSRTDHADWMLSPPTPTHYFLTKKWSWFFWHFFFFQTHHSFALYSFPPCTLLLSPCRNLKRAARLDI